MSMTDPIADMLTRIRNAQHARHPSVVVPRSNMKLALARLLKEEGFIDGYVEVEDDKQGVLKLFLKYDTSDEGIIRGLERVSSPGRRVYVGKHDIPRVRNGLGVVVLTTSSGLLTDRQARKAGVGGEIVCRVW